MSKNQKRTLLDIAAVAEGDKGMEKSGPNEEEKSGAGSGAQTPVSPSTQPLSSPLILTPPISVNLSPVSPGNGPISIWNDGPNPPTTIFTVKKPPECPSTTNSSQESIAGTSPSQNSLGVTTMSPQSLPSDIMVPSIREESSEDRVDIPQRGKSHSEPPKPPNSILQPNGKRRGYSQSSSTESLSLDGSLNGSKGQLQTILEPVQTEFAENTPMDSDSERKDGATDVAELILENGDIEQNSSPELPSKSEPRAKRKLNSKYTVMSPGAKAASLDSGPGSPRRGSMPVRPTFRYNATNETLSMEAPDVYEENSSPAGTDEHASFLDHDLDIAAQILARKPSDLDMYSDTDFAQENGDFNKSISSVTSEGSRKSYDGKKRKSSYWYSVLSPNYKSKCEDFKKLFKDIPNEERLVVDYSCALQKDILVHGRLYVTQNWICFYANIFRWETHITIRCKDITAMTKEKTARVIPNAIQICTKNDKLFLTSFGARDKTYLMLFRVWQNALLDQPMTPQELWQWVHYSYGEELGLTSSDDDYIAPSSEGDKTSDNQVSPTDSSLTKAPSLEECRNLPDDSCPPLDLTQPKDQLDGASTTGEINGAAMVLQAADGDTIPSSFHDLIEKNDLSLATLNSSEKIGNDVDLPTDLSDNTEDTDDGEVTCSGHNHFSITVMNEVFQISVDQMFEHLFTDSSFFRDLTTARKTYDLVLSPWQDLPNPDGHRQRIITYTLTLNSSLGPKTSAATETQTCYSQSKPGVLYVVDTETTNSGIPYGESFYVVSRYCIQRVNSQKCRLFVTSDIKYKKSVWGMVKGFIDKNCTHGIHEYFNALAVHLRRESDKAAVGCEPQKKKKLRKRRGTTEANQQQRQTPDIPPSTSPTVVNKAQHKDEWLLKLNAESLVRILSIVLVVLVLFNAVLYYKLCALEVAANYHPGKPFRFTHEDLGKYPKTHDDWVNLLKQQQSLHNLELDRWRNILTSSIQLVEQMKMTLTELKSSIEKTDAEQKVEL